MIELNEIQEVTNLSEGFRLLELEGRKPRVCIQMKECGRIFFIYHKDEVRCLGIDDYRKCMSIENIDDIFKCTSIYNSNVHSRREYKEKILKVKNIELIRFNEKRKPDEDYSEISFSSPNKLKYPSDDFMYDSEIIVTAEEVIKT